LRYAQSEIEARPPKKPPQRETGSKEKLQGRGAGCVWKNRLKGKTSKAGKFGFWKKKQGQPDAIKAAGLCRACWMILGESWREAVFHSAGGER